MGSVGSSLKSISFHVRMTRKNRKINLRRSGLEVVEGMDFQGIISGSIILSPWNKARFLIISLCSSRGV